MVVFNFHMICPALKNAGEKGADRLLKQLFKQFIIAKLCVHFFLQQNICKNVKSDFHIVNVMLQYDCQFMCKMMVSIS